MTLDLAHADYATILFGLTVATGLAWVVDVAVTRRPSVAAAIKFPDAVDAPPVEARQRPVRRPAWIALAAGLFPVLLAVFVLRSFLFEPFRIPSGSMIPTLRVGDLILVNKFAYGLRLPIVDRELLPIGRPQRGDVVVFRYPVDPTEHYVKRVIGLPGDTIVYRRKQLTVNGRPVRTAAAPDLPDPDGGTSQRQFVETLPRIDGAIAHPIVVDDRRDDRFGPIVPFPDLDHCAYAENDTAVSCTVPPGRYFVMGDNRDNSADSRFWGFVPEANLVGKAVAIWMHFDDLGRIGTIH